MSLGDRIADCQYRPQQAVRQRPKAAQGTYASTRSRRHRAFAVSDQRDAQHRRRRTVRSSRRRTDPPPLQQTGDRGSRKQAASAVGDEPGSAVRLEYGWPKRLHGVPGRGSCRWASIAWSTRARIALDVAQRQTSQQTGSRTPKSRTRPSGTLSGIANRKAPTFASSSANEPCSRGRPALREPRPLPVQQRVLQERVIFERRIVGGDRCVSRSLRRNTRHVTCVLACRFHAWMFHGSFHTVGRARSRLNVLLDVLAGIGLLFGAGERVERALSVAVVGG